MNSTNRIPYVAKREIFIPWLLIGLVEKDIFVPGLLISLEKREIFVPFSFFLVKHTFH